MIDDRFLHRRREEEKKRESKERERIGIFKADFLPL